MRIGIFTDTYLPYVSGLVTSELMLKKSLEEMGNEVYIVTANLQNFKYIYNKKDKIIKIPGVPIGIYDARLTSIYNINAINQIKKWKLDIIHSQTEFGIGTFARIVSKQLNIPLVHTYHTMYEDYIYYITKGHFDKPSKKLVEYLTKFYCDTTVTELIVPSRKIYNIFINKYDVNKKINIIGTGMDIDRFSINIDKNEVDKLKKKYKIKDSDFVIGSVSRLAKEKSVDKIINSFSKIKSKISNAKLLLVGDGPLSSELKELAHNTNYSNDIIFTRKVETSKVQYYYQLMDIFTTFSVTETQGLTVLEAMASSLPVLVIKDDSFIDYVLDGENGYLFLDTNEYINDVYKLYKDKNLYDKFSKKSYELSKLHSFSSFGEKVYEVYKDTINNYNKENKIITNIKEVIDKVTISDKNK